MNSQTYKLTNSQAHELMSSQTHKLIPSQNEQALSATFALRACVLKKGGHLLSRIALQYHRRRRA